MAFDNIKRNIKEVIDLLNTYVQSNITYYKLKAVKQIVKTGGKIFKLGMLVVFMPLVLLFFSVAGAIWIGNWLNNYALGFVIIGGVLLILLFGALIIGSIIFRRITIKRVTKKLFKGKG